MSEYGAAAWLDVVAWNSQGLVPVIVQDHASGEVLMFAWMNREALQRTVASGEAVFWSRSRQKLWHKGEASGHIQRIHELRIDCDQDVILLRVEQQGGIACHSGRRSCFFRRFMADGTWEITDAVIKDPKEIYK